MNENCTMANSTSYNPFMDAPSDTFSNVSDNAYLVFVALLRPILAVLLSELYITCSFFNIQNIFWKNFKDSDHCLVLRGSVPLLVYYVFIKRKMQFHAVVFLRKLGSTAILM